ncbi:BRCA1-A complex subunit Abraxas-like [Fopius arisanus]|uniref:BRCA1-A complex subunit Abraxas-like n=1 Tax=Fopius arisanus TaxID=64838 RepID=A0A9R1ST65_9HYME|nr:PREDICTED: BRCA1-A complex subunit Abraxas-like [Fopius arisanus]
MAENELMVTISGAALSLLFYENVRSRGDQMGFFFGEVLSFVTKNVTDSERHVESVKVHVDIQSIIKCSPTDQIYNAAGEIKEDNLKDFIKDKGKNVVGWFRFRRNGSLTPTLRDKILHKQFLSIFRDPSNQINEDYFVACMLNTSMTLGEGTHKFKHVFLHYKQGMYNPIPLRINNLGHDATRHDGSDYKPSPRKYCDEPDAFTKFVKSLNLDLARTPGIHSISEIQRAAEQHLEDLVPLIVKTDQEVAELERSVLETRRALFEKLMEKELRSREAQLIDTKCRSRRDKFQRNEESTSRASRCQDDSWLSKDSSITPKQKTRHSMAFDSHITPSPEQLPNPYATRKSSSYSQAAKKTTERMIDDSEPDC